MKIKSILIIVLLFIPFIVMADDNNTCEQINTSTEKTMDISIIQNINNKENIDDEIISEFKFNYKILDLDDNVLAETSNDKNGHITFHCFNAKASEIGNYKLYKIIMEDNENIPFDYDPYVIYFSLRPNYTNELFDPIIAFYKDDGNDEEKYNIKYKGEVFHATDEELQGQAYAVLDKDTGLLTFFRDEPNKYTNLQEIGNKVYYTNFENNSYYGWLDYGTKPLIKKIVFADAIKPQYIQNWFSGLTNLEELDISKLDTSLVNNLYGFLNDTGKLKKIDISTMDTKNVRDLSYSFINSGIEYIDFTYWNFESLQSRSFPELLKSSLNLKYLNISNFNMESSSAEFTNLTCLEKIVISDDYNFYRSGFRSSNIWYNPQKNKSYTAMQIIDILTDQTESMAGYYIRPTCTTEAAFTSIYNPNKIKGSTITDNSKKDDTVKNPDTSDNLVVVVFLITISLGVIIFIYKRKCY